MAEAITSSERLMSGGGRRGDDAGASRWVFYLGVVIHTTAWVSVASESHLQGNGCSRISVCALRHICSSRIPHVSD